MTTNLEKYLAGEPLSELNAAVKRGELAEQFMTPLRGLHGSMREPLTDAERPLRPDEQAALREMRQGPGWPVLQRLLERATISHTNAAILMSQDDPTGEPAKLATLWVTVKVWKNMVNLLNQMVATELAEQERQAKVNGAGHEAEPTEQGA